MSPFFPETFLPSLIATSTASAPLLERKAASRPFGEHDVRVSRNSARASL